jgi:hypothetical protein
MTTGRIFRPASFCGESKAVEKEAKTQKKNIPFFSHSEFLI